MAGHRGPAARAVHPRGRHLLPMMVSAGAAGADRGRVAYAGTILGLPLFSGYYTVFDRALGAGRGVISFATRR